MFGVQPLKLLLVVDHENLPEDTLVRLREDTSSGGRGGLEEDTSLSLDWLSVGRAFACYTLAFLLIPIAFQSSS